jgi:acylphosphatase
LRYLITVSGEVQGVYYRVFAQKKAKELGIKGYIKNMPDGTVYCEAEGEEMALEAFADWCAEGSPYSRVESVNVEVSAGKGYEEFEIRK